MKAHDSFGGDEHFSLTLRITPIPEPNPALMLALALVGLARRRRLVS